MRFSHLLAAAVATSSTTVALSGALNSAHVNDENLLVGRQNDNSDKSAAPANSQPLQTAAPTPSNKDSSPTNAPASGSAGASNSNGTRITTGKPHSTAFDPQLPPGGVSMITPNPFAGVPLYKVGDYVTFAWNFTSLKLTPSAVDVIASCTLNQATYTLANNMSADQTSIVWNTKETPSGQAPFLTEQYKLYIYDADSSVSAPARPGLLAAWQPMLFAMYTPQPYIKYADFNCPNCNGALSQFERMTLGALIMTAGTTVGSFLYFTYAFGIW